ncbi:flavin reductase family protein [Pseudonocardia lacus]|uniref:flavin reductase family protein n=1 Tax=Pseudonocardia lacus TaxID=2835865 RepID=UPI001BDCBB14|nr:flavin reductase family protein [Pseudonocardia lacus]
MTGAPRAVEHPVAQAFRAAFRAHPAGVAIITARAAHGPVGVTASSVASVSVRPPAVSFSLAAAASATPAVVGAGSVLVHLLDADDAPLARRFAGPAADRFGPGTPWRSADGGEPHLHEVGTALRCCPHRVVEVGDSLLVAAFVTAVLGPGHRGLPLVYAERGYHPVATAGGAQLASSRSLAS